MNWKDAPHLFFGFRVLSKARPKVDEPDIIDGLFLDNFNDYAPPEEKDNCTLIARPIEDMTDEEKNEILYEDDQLRYMMKGRGLPSWILLYPLSIGVYPFEDTTDVEFVTKNN